LLDHLLRGGPHEIERAPHRDVDRPLEAFHLGDVEELPVAIRGVAHGDGQLAEVLDGSGDQPFDGGLIGDVAGHSHSPPTGSFAFLDDVLRPLLVRAIVDHDAGPRSRQRDRRRLADSQTRASDDGDFSLQINGHGEGLSRLGM
jgi:hypothetical protein